MHPSNYLHNQGIVYKKTIGNYFVHTNGRVVTCAISPRLRKQLIYPTADPNSLAHIVRDVKDIQAVDPVAVGDEVAFVDAQDGSGLIVDVLPRRNKLVRRSSPGAARRAPHYFEQVIVANLDQVVPVFAAANPTPSWNLLDRYLASAESLDLAALICITKMDLVAGSEAEDELLETVETYRKIGYTVLLTSSTTGLGMEEFRQALRDKVSVFIGKSGVGKTSLLNAMQPGLGLRVNEVSRITGKGKHTTTHLEMVPLEMGGAVVDTPGMREFGLWDVEDTDLALFFPEMAPYVGRCKFGLDCSHTNEPGCAIRKAVMAGQVSERRYHSMLVLQESSQ